MEGLFRTVVRDSVHASESVRDLSRDLSRVLFMHRLGAVVSRLAGAVIEIGSDLRISPYLSDTSQRNHASVILSGVAAAAGHYR